MPRSIVRALPQLPGNRRPGAGRDLAQGEGRCLGPGAGDDARGLPRLRAFRWRSEQEWLAWLKRILAHNAADFVRRYRGTAKRQARREVPIRSPQDSTHAFGAAEPAAPCPTPSQEFLQIDNELRVTAALAQLPADYQEVIVLRNLQRLSFNEVAERMERSRPAVQMLWMRAIKKLQEEMGDEGSGMKDEG